MRYTAEHHSTYSYVKEIATDENIVSVSERGNARNTAEDMAQALQDAYEDGFKDGDKAAKTTPRIHRVEAGGCGDAMPCGCI